MKRKGKAVALSAVALGFVVLVVMGFLVKDWAMEQWLIITLKEHREAQRLQVVHVLSERHCVRAVPAIVQSLEGASAWYCMSVEGSLFRLIPEEVPCRDASVKRAMPMLVQFLRENDPTRHSIALSILSRVG